MKRFFLVLVALVLLLPAAPALADGTSCWCRDAAWICTHHRANQVVPGGTTGGPITDAQCRSFCEGQGKSPNLRPDYSDAGDVCRINCVTGGSCSADPAITGVTPAENTCIANDAAYRDIETLARCCEYLRTEGESAGGSVGYSGTVQSCGADTVPGETAASSTTMIRLFNPLGRDTDIPAFIGRGIRGVLGVIGAIALLMFVYGGVVWMTAGDSKRVDDAKNIIKNSVIGLLLIFFSYNLIGVFFDFFS